MFELPEGVSVNTYDNMPSCIKHVLLTDSKKRLL